MKTSYRIIPCYSGDVSGVCSALYELGGMVVIHDPSGCNSTYNTHDETRWYHQNSLIFISGLKERDAIMGNDDKFIKDVIDAAELHHPNFIALCSSPIPYINGTDFEGISRLIEHRTGIPTFYVETNGMHDYTVGVGNALKEIAQRFTTPQTSSLPNTVNILGLTPLDYNDEASIDALFEWVEKAGWKINSSWSMRSSFEKLSTSGRAELNLVVSASGLLTAKLLHEKFGTPFVVGVPIKNFDEALKEAMYQAALSGNSSIPYLQGSSYNERTVTLVGEPVLMGSVAAAVRNKFGYATRVLCPLEVSASLLGPSDLLVKGEEEVEAHLRKAELIAADPYYRPVCNPTANFYGLPHQAFSGRCTWKDRFNLFQTDIN